MPSLTDNLGPNGYIMPANAISGSSITPASDVWANRALYQTQVGRIVRFTDVGGGNPTGGGGSFWYWNGTRWKTLNNQALLDAIDTANAGAANTTEQQLNPTHALIPAGVIGLYDRLLMRLTFTKNGGSDSATLRLRFGPLGTVADPVIATITALAATNQSYGTLLEFKRVSATQLEQEGSADPSTSFVGPSAAAAPAPVTVGNLDTLGMYLSLTAQMTSGTEIPTLKDYTLEVLSAEA